MIKASMTLVLSILLAGLVHAQSATDAPIDWTPYKIGDHKLSISFPKLPIRTDQADLCNEKKTDYFLAYAEEVVYKLTVVKRQKPAFPISFCRTSSNFGIETLNARRAELEKSSEKISSDGATELWTSRPGGINQKVWIIDELKKGRWIELTVTGRGDLPKAEEFMRSLDRTSDGNAIAVGDGSEQTLGDRGVDTSVMVASPTPDSITKEAGSEPLAIIGKVKAQYTDAARSNKEQGTVTLRVTFLANGGIGNIDVTKGLKYGLTERAIAAAKKMVFLPQRVKGVPASTSRPVSFSFNIY